MCTSVYFNQIHKMQNLCYQGTSYRGWHIASSLLRRTCNKLQKVYENILTENFSQINEHEKSCLTCKFCL